MLTVLAVAAAVIMLVLCFNSVIRLEENVPSFIFFVFFAVISLFALGWYFYGKEKTKFIPRKVIRIYHWFDDITASGWNYINEKFLSNNNDNADSKNSEDSEDSENPENLNDSEGSEEE